MVHDGDEHVLVIGYAEKVYPQRDVGGQIERAACSCLEGLLQFVGRPLLRIDDMPTEFGFAGGDDDLPRCAARRSEQRAQALVPCHHVGQCRFQRDEVQCTAAAQCRRHVVHR